MAQGPEHCQGAGFTAVRLRSLHPGRVPLGRKVAWREKPRSEAETLNQPSHIPPNVRFALTDGRAGLRVVRILEAAQASIRDEGKRVWLEGSS